MEKTLGDIIREARVEQGLGLRELARKLDMTPSYLSDIENDRRVPSEEVLEGIAKALNLNFDELMAMAGRFGEQALRYLQRTPSVGALFRTISNKRLDPKDVEKLRIEAEKLGKQKPTRRS